jgi:hypothetical protein
MTALYDKFDCIHVVDGGGITNHSRPGDSFVEDTTSNVTNDDVTMEPVERSEIDLKTEEEALIAKMEEIIHFFLECLQITGGDLAPDKCVWYLIAH